MIDVTKNKTQLIWVATYKYTEIFFNDRTDLKVGVEIGVAGGQHIKHLLETTKIEKIYGVDPYDSVTWNTGVNTDDLGGLDSVYDSVKESLDVFGDRVEMIRNTSLAAANDFENESLDFVFIDAMHDYDNCLLDIKAWEPKVKKGGYVMGHDWDHQSFPGVEKAVVEIFGRENITGIESPVHVWYVKK